MKSSSGSPAAGTPAPDTTAVGPVPPGGNAEDCPRCEGTNPPYPWVCPGHPAPDTADFDGCNSECRKAGAHSLRWGGCEHAPKPEPRVSILRTRRMDDGENSIVTESLTVTELAERVQAAMRTAVRLPGMAYTAAALAVAVDLAEQPAPDEPVDTPREQRNELINSLFVSCRCGHDPTVHDRLGPVVCQDCDCRGYVPAPAGQRPPWPKSLAAAQGPADLARNADHYLHGDKPPAPDGLRQQYADRVRKALRDYGEGDYDPGTGDDYSDETAVVMAVRDAELEETEAEMEQRGRTITRLEGELQQLRADLERYEETVVGDLNEANIDLARQAARAVALIRDFLDPGPCRLDHHGYCQAHTWLCEGRCPHAAAREFLAELDAREAYDTTTD